MGFWRPGAVPEIKGGRDDHATVWVSMVMMLEFAREPDICSDPEIL